jgi:hypothetical protein
MKMYYDLVSANYIDGYQIELTFEDGKSGIVDFQKYIEKGGIFSRLKDLELFRNFQINKDFRIISWNAEIDIAPETLYSDATGAPLPNWMESESGLRKTG